MAYISHSPFDYRSLRERAGNIAPSLLIRSAFVAVAVAVATLALSEAYAPAATTAPLAHKGDRLQTSGVVANDGVAQVSTNIAAQTTTIERGTAAGLSPASPMNAVVK